MLIIADIFMMICRQNLLRSLIADIFTMFSRRD